MARFGSSSTQVVMAMFVVVLFYVSGIMAQNIAPSPAMDTGAGISLPVSGVVACSSILVSLIALLLQ
ncbi:hypothetical protein COLO4_28708 [Corchorus olitorius]|uniref:Uncharacterized protein n=1 Tax=Corchorus olitorius TaxID=93759 RepID=A0A1R3HIR5_9ROSI|nr:hypothetical protein COLO4_28708 [Corchorus olitorius]